MLSSLLLPPILPNFSNDNLSSSTNKAFLKRLVDFLAVIKGPRVASAVLVADSAQWR